MSNPTEQPPMPMEKGEQPPMPPIEGFFDESKVKEDGDSMINFAENFDYDGYFGTIPDIIIWNEKIDLVKEFKNLIENYLETLNPPSTGKNSEYVDNQRKEEISYQLEVWEKYGINDIGQHHIRELQIRHNEKES